MIPSRVFAPLYVSRKDRCTIFNRSPDSSSISNNNRRWEDSKPFSVGKLRGDDDYGNYDRRMYNVTTMTTSSTSRDYDLYDQQIMREEQRDYRDGQIMKVENGLRSKTTTQQMIISRIVEAGSMIEMIITAMSMMSITTIIVLLMIGMTCMTLICDDDDNS